MPSLDQLKALLAADPADSFLRYGIAMEFAKQHRYAEAMLEFETLVQQNPDYVAAYFMAGRTQEQDGNIEHARTWYRRGISTAQRMGDTHAAGEIASALDAIS